MVWLRRIVVWAVTSGLLIWLGVAGYRVLFGRPEPVPDDTEASPGTREIPTETTGEYKYEKPRTFLKGGRQLLRAGDTSGGLDTLLQLVANYPDSPQARPALMVIASTYRYNLNDPKKAMRYYTQLVRDYPDDRQVAMAVRYLRELAQEPGTPDRTRTLLQNALQKLEGNPQAAARIQKLLDDKR